MNKRPKPGLILIFDDIASNLKVLFTYLANAGFEVIVIKSTLVFTLRILKMYVSSLNTYSV